MTEKDFTVPNFNPTRQAVPDEKIDQARSQVIAAARLGCTDKEISTIVGISESVIKRRMREELDEGRNTMRASLRKAQLEMAINEKNPTMLIWLGKCYLGQKEPKYNIEHSGGLTVEKVIFEPSLKVIELEAVDDKNDKAS